MWARRHAGAQIVDSARRARGVAIVAAASDAPVVAVASARQVWISRDDGKTFARALESGGEIASLFVEPGGRVYVVRRDVGNHGHTESLGIAELDGRERWREPPPASIPHAARDGWIVGLAGAGGLVVGWDDASRWEGIPASLAWNPWRMAMGKHRVSYALITTNDDTGNSMHLLAASEAERARIVWSLPGADRVGEGAVVPCAGFGADTLHLVVRGRTPGSSRLVSIGPDGREHERALAGQLLDDRDLMCEIAGNDRAST